MEKKKVKLKTKPVKTTKVTRPQAKKKAPKPAVTDQPTVPTEKKVEFSVSSMPTISLRDGTRIMFAEGTTFEHGIQALDIFRAILQSKQTESESLRKSESTDEK